MCASQNAFITIEAYNLHEHVIKRNKRERVEEFAKSKSPRSGVQSKTRNKNG